MLDRVLSRTRILEKALDASWLRNEVIAQNLANVDTPGYKRKTVSFEEYLSEAMDNKQIKGNKTDPRHFSIGKNELDNIPVSVTEDNSSTSVRLDGNNVDVENEMAAMAKNTIQYNTLTQSLNAEFRRLRSAISEGRR